MRAFPRLAARLAAGVRGHTTAVASVILGALALVYLGPALIGGRVLSPNSVLFLFAPWRAHAPPGFESTWNPTLSDIPTAYYPWNVFARTMLHAGTFPTWNPYAYSGTPFFANAQTGLINPFNVPIWLLALNTGIAVSAWLKVWIAGFGAYRLARELKLTPWPALLAGVSFALCAFNVVWLTFETLPTVSAMLPWALLFAERLACRRRAGDAVALAFVCAIAVVAGHPETAVQMFAGTALYLAVRLLSLADPSWIERGRRALVASSALLAGATLSAVVLLPVLRAGLGTPGAALRSGGTFSLPWSAAKTSLFPNWWEIKTLPLPGPADYNVRTFYVGTGTLLLAFVAILSGRRYREKVALIVLAAVGFGASFGVPGVHWLAANLPPLNQTTTPYMLLWFEVAMPVLAGFGLQSLLEEPQRRRVAWSVLAVAGVVALIAVLAVAPSVHELRTTLNHLRTGRSYADPKIVALTSVAWMALFAVLLGAALVLLRRPSTRRWAAAAVVLVVAIDMLHYSNGYQPMLASAQATPPSTPAVSYLQQHVGGQRIVGIGNTLANDYDMVYGLRDIRGYDPPQPSYRYLRLWQLANPAQIAVQPFQLMGVSPVGLKVISLLGARYVIDDPIDPPIPPLRNSVVYRGPDAVIYRNARAAPLVSVAERVQRVAGERGALQAISSAAFDPRREAIIEATQPGAGRIPSHTQGGTAVLLSTSNSTIALRSQLPSPALVTLGETMSAGWSVTVDGRPRPALVVDDYARGVLAPAGVHVIVWHYEIPSFDLGLALTIATALGLMLGAGAAASRRRRAHRQPGAPGTAEPVAARAEGAQRAG